MNVQVFVDFSLSRGEDPEPFRTELEANLESAPFQFSWPEHQGSLGWIWIMVEDDDLTEAYRLFETTLASTEDGGYRSINVRVLSEEDAK